MSDSGPLPLRAVYLLTRTDDPAAPVSVEELSKVEGLRELLTHTPPLDFLLQTVYDRYWRFLAELVERVPINRLSYPSGFDRLDEVRSMLARSL